MRITASGSQVRRIQFPPMPTAERPAAFPAGGALIWPRSSGAWRATASHAGASRPVTASAARNAACSLTRIIVFRTPSASATADVETTPAAWTGSVANSNEPRTVDATSASCSLSIPCPSFRLARGPAG